MNSNFNLLFDIFDHCILMEDLSDLTPELFAKAVAEQYIEAIQKEGMIIPQASYHMLLASISEETLNIYRKKSYGFYDLKAYQKSVIHKISENDF